MNLWVYTNNVHKKNREDKMMALFKTLFFDEAPSATQAQDLDQELEDLSQGFIYTLGLEGQDRHPGLDA